MFKQTVKVMVTGVKTQFICFRTILNSHMRVGVGGFSKVVATFNHVGGSFNLSMATIRNVWMIPSFRIWDYVLHVEHISCVLKNCGQHQSVIPSPLSIALYSVTQFLYEIEILYLSEAWYYLSLKGGYVELCHWPIFLKSALVATMPEWHFLLRLPFMFLKKYFIILIVNTWAARFTFITENDVSQMWLVLAWSSEVPLHRLGDRPHGHGSTTGAYHCSESGSMVSYCMVYNP